MKFTLSRILFLFCVLFFHIDCICNNCKEVSDFDCNESIKWAVDLNSKPIYNNKLFTKGFTIFIEWVDLGEQSKDIKLYIDKVSNDIVNAYRNAIIQWGTSLVINKSFLDSNLVRYLNEMTLQNGDGTSIYNGPQVIKVNCPENASIIFKVFSKYGESFPGKKDELANAQIEGRTILLNFEDHNFFYNTNVFSIKNSINEINLVTVLAHEIGHTFGLRHNMAINGKTIMYPQLANLPNIPTKLDGLNFSKILSNSIEGSLSEYFDFTNCEGLKLE